MDSARLEVGEEVFFGGPGFGFGGAGAEVAGGLGIVGVGVYVHYDEGADAVRVADGVVPGVSAAGGVSDDYHVGEVRVESAKRFYVGNVVLEAVAVVAGAVAVAVAAAV